MAPLLLRNIHVRVGCVYAVHNVFNAMASGNETYIVLALVDIEHACTICLSYERALAPLAVPCMHATYGVDEYTTSVSHTTEKKRKEEEREKRKERGEGEEERASERRKKKVPIDTFNCIHSVQRKR